MLTKRKEKKERKKENEKKEDSRGDSRLQTAGKTAESSKTENPSSANCRLPSAVSNTDYRPPSPVNNYRQMSTTPPNSLPDAACPPIEPRNGQKDKPAPKKPTKEDTEQNTLFRITNGIYDKNGRIVQNVDGAVFNSRLPNPNLYLNPMFAHLTPDEQAEFAKITNLLYFELCEVGGKDVTDSVLHRAAFMLVKNSNPKIGEPHDVKSFVSLVMHGKGLIYNRINGITSQWFVDHDYGWTIDKLLLAWRFEKDIAKREGREPRKKIFPSANAWANKQARLAGRKDSKADGRHQTADGRLQTAGKIGDSRLQTAESSKTENPSSANCGLPSAVSNTDRPAELKGFGDSLRAKINGTRSSPSETPIAAAERAVKNAELPLQAILMRLGKPPDVSSAVKINFVKGEIRREIREPPGMTREQRKAFYEAVEKYSAAVMHARQTTAENETGMLKYLEQTHN